MRLDKYIFENGFASSRTEAQKLISNQYVKVNSSICTKASLDIKECDIVTVLPYENKYVSRGGYKLESILESSGVLVDGLVCLDIGASTGGFTDCLLQHGASLVYALENGSGQLHKKLKEDNRVISLENQNARYLTKELFENEIEIVTMDVSFISQTLILPSVANILCKGGHLFSLIKPQFEAGKENLGKNGIVKNEKARKLAIDRVLDTAKILGFTLIKIEESPIVGGDGNIEYMAHFVL